MMGGSFLGGCGYGNAFNKEWIKMTKVYAFSQLPVARDFNENLAQGVSYMAGITQYFK